MRTITYLAKSLSFTALIILLLSLLVLPASAQDPVYTLAISGGDNQSAAAGTRFTNPLQLTITDASSAPVAGVALTFAAPDNEASAFLTGPGSAYTNTLTIKTDANGVASANATANCTPGAYQVTATLGGQSVTFNLTNSGSASADCTDSSWVADPLDPGHPAPGANTPIDSTVEGYWWRDTNNQNALLQHSLTIGAEEVRALYTSATLNVYVYVPKGGPNVTLITTAHDYAVVGCGGGTREARLARNKLGGLIAGKTLRGVIMNDIDYNTIWGCKEWTKAQQYAVLYANASFDSVLQDNFFVETAATQQRNTFIGTNLPWGPDGRLGAGTMREWQAVAPQYYQEPTYLVSNTTDITLEGNTVRLIPANAEDAGLLVQIPEANNTVVVGEYVGDHFPDMGLMQAGKVPISAECYLLDHLRTLAPGVLVPKGGQPIVGGSDVMTYILNQRDALQSVRDQTLNLINQGYTEDAIAALVKLPAGLANSPYLREFASDIPSIVRMTWSTYMGAWDGNATSLAPTLTESKKAQILADAMGGVDNLLAAATQVELNARDLESAEKALYLADAAYRVAPDNFAAKQVYAQALRKVAYLQKSAYKRNYYISAALALGTEQIVTDFAKSGDEDKPLAFTAAEFSQHFFGISGASLQTVEIAGLPPTEHGVLKLAGTDVAAGQEIPVGELNGLAFTPTGNWNGTTSFTWSGASGGSYATTGATVTISIMAMNDAPVVSSPLADVTYDEDAASATFDLSEVFTGVDGTPLSYTVASSKPGLISATLEGAILTLDFQAEQNGEATVTVSAADQQGEQVAAWATDDFVVTVNPVNDAPRANSQTELVTAGLARTFSLDYGDVETAKADLVLHFDGPSHGTLDTSALPLVTYIAPANYKGPDSFTYTVADRGDPDGCTATPCSGVLQVQATVSLDVAENSIRGRIYNDANANGSPDAGETGVAGVTVRLTPLDGRPAVELVSAADGTYAFGSLVPGSYQVRQVLLPGYVQTTPDPAGIDLAMGQAVGGIDFGVVQSADLSVRMTADVNDKTIIYTFVVTNAGPADALEAVLTNVRPHGTAYKSIITTQGACQGGNTVTCGFGTVPAGGSVTVTIEGSRTDKKNPIENTATVTASTFDIALGNNSATVTVQ